ncbi:MAG: GAF domain-containing protein [Cytophagales bacterium]|nr:GAF domain-containing protein [Cytophagales bacterium]
MATFLHFIQNLGVQKKMNPLLQKKFYFTNNIALVLLLIGIAGIGFRTLSENFALDIPSVSLILVYLTVLASNYLGLINVSRLLLCNLMPLIFTLAHLTNITQASQKSLPIFLLQLTFSCLPWVLFEIREKKLIISSVAFNSVLILWFILSDGLGESDKIVKTFSESIAYIPYTICVVFLFLCAGFAEKWMGFLIQKDNLKLTQELETNNRLIEEKTKSLNQHVEHLQSKQQEEKKEQWINKSTTELSSLLQQANHSNHQSLFDDLLRTIVKALKANQGALYVVEREEGDTGSGSAAIELKSIYAYDRKRHQSQRFEPGEGLIGQAYLEAQPIYMTEVPKDYVKITSGTGGSQPRAIILIPCIQDDKVEGIIELASFREFQPHERRFLERAGKIISSFLSSYRVTLQTKRLLEETRIQAEQMQAQEEEMRQNLEEFMSVQEDLERKVKEYEIILKEHSLL